MIIYKRQIESKIESLLFKGRMIAILGPRQSGKTTLSKKIISQYGNDGAYFDCQINDVREHFIVGKPNALLSLIKGKKIVVFDEAQTIQDIGTILKVFHDTYPEIQIIATGSSSFDLANKINEPMTGRVFEFILLPLSLKEIRMVKNITKEDLMDYLLFGTYPAVVSAETRAEKEIVLKNIATNYLYKDVFVFEAIRNPRIFEDLVKMLALQIGQMVSVNELSVSLGISRSVVQKYLRLLEQSFIIKIVHSFSQNSRNELKKAFKVFFLDLGVRNSLVDIKKLLEVRADKGVIFENFFITERLKYGTLETFPPEIMFWRTRTGLEIDFIEKSGLDIIAYECKWSDTDVSFKEFLKLYPNAKTSVVTPDNLIKKVDA
ncbi:MAG: ATP-binding protein [Patescibacteria group bacterium]